MSEWARPVELEVFATGTTTLTERDPARPDPDPRRPDHHGDVGDRLPRAVLDLHARPGYRPGQRIPTTSARRGGATDIVRPLLLRPWPASEAATSGRWLREPIGGFDVDTPEAGDDRYLVWHALLSGSHVARVPVALHLLAAPSMVVTVLELVPQRRLRWQRAGFVEDGVAVMDELAERLLAICAEDRVAPAVGHIA